jgi:hypothetical protein
MAALAVWVIAAAQARTHREWDHSALKGIICLGGSLIRAA